MSTAAQRRAFYEASRPLAEMFAFKPGDDPTLRSRSRDVRYRMLVLPEGLGVHQDEGCEGEIFNGPLACWHSLEITRYTMTTQAVTPYQGAVTPTAIDFNSEQMAVIKSTIAKGATDTELQFFVALCKRTGLDPFLKQIYAIKRYDSREKKETMQVQVGIDGLRLIAERTGKFAGMDPVEWLDVNGQWSEVWTGAGEYPVAARCAVYRKDFDRKVPAVARWDSYAQYFGNPARLSSMWEKMPDVMLGKCAESLAMRRAFPAEMSGLAQAIDSEYDPAVEVAEQIQAEPEPDHGDYIDSTVTSTPMATDEQRKAIAKLWDPKHARIGELRQRFRRAFPVPGTGGVNDTKVLTAVEADEVIAILEDKPETPVGASDGAAEVARQSSAERPSPVCEHEARMDEQRSILVCAKCGVALEGPDAVQAPALPM